MKKSLRSQYPREYRIWKAMRARCNSPCNSNTYYQINNIQVDKHWDSFSNFISDMRPCPEKYSIDRIDCSGNYCKDNCRWASNSTQANNKINHNILITYNDKTQTLKTWARELKINYTTLYTRMFRNNLSFIESVSSDPFNKLYMYRGISYSLSELSEFTGIPKNTIVDRNRRGWDIERIINQKIRKVKI